MSQKRQVSLYVSLLSSLAISTKYGRVDEAKETFLNIMKRLQEDFCPPFDRASLLTLSSDLYTFALCRKRQTVDKDDERYFTLLIELLEGLSHTSSFEYDLGKSEELISICAKKSRTMQGSLYLTCVRSLLFLTGNTL